MAKLKRIKNYKNREPMDTVAYIKNILSDAGIEVDARFYHEDVSNVDSCRIKITNKGFQNNDIGTNGKGMNKEYCLASAYGEFMERLQNTQRFRGMMSSLLTAFMKKSENADVTVAADINSLS